MARRVYTDNDRALVHTVLMANEGNVKRTARETNIPSMTVRDWKQKWEREGVPAAVQVALPAVRDEFVQNAERVRDKALVRIEQTLDDPDSKVGLKEGGLIVGILTDKIRLIEGKPTSRTESSDSGGNLPIEQVRELFAGFAKGLVEGARERDAAISSAVNEEEPIEGEWEQVSPEALPAAS